MSLYAGSIVRFRMPDSGCIRKALVVDARSHKPGHVRLRPARYPTYAQQLRGDYDPWVKTPCWVPLRDLVYGAG